MKLNRAELHILLVEDSQADVTIIERALREKSVPHRLTVVGDGRHAVDYLINLRDNPAVPDQEPDLILLDLNLPKLNGQQVLEQIKSDPRLRMIPVVILTTSVREEDIEQTYQAGANTYIPKPSDYPSYCELVETLRDYWLHTAALAPRHIMRGSAQVTEGGSG